VLCFSAPPIRLSRSPTGGSRTAGCRTESLVVEVAKHVAASIPGAVLDVLPNCGHFSFLDAPDGVRERVAAFVRTR
jgi:pimeloyl-ACP methyl ester carboxylesterase